MRPWCAGRRHLDFAADATLAVHQHREAEHADPRGVDIVRVAVDGDAEAPGRAVRSIETVRRTAVDIHFEGHAERLAARGALPAR